LSKLLNLQEWVTCHDAARFLTERSKEAVSKAAVLRLALHGRLKLSVFLPSPTWALLGNLINVDDMSEHFPPDSYTWVEEGDAWYDRDHYIKANRRNSYNEWVSSKDTLIVDGGRKQVLEVKSGVEIEGIWDLTMRGGERNYVYGLSIGKTVRSIHPKGVQCLGEVPVVKHPTEQDNLAYALLPELPFVRFLPKNSFLVVRTVELQELEKRISSVKEPQAEFANAKRENTDLKRRIEAVLTYARKQRFPTGTSQTKMAKKIKEQQKHERFSESALRKILSGRYGPMRRLGLDGLT
jgi:hypothetical protein